MWDWWCFSFNPNKYYPDNPSSQNLLPLRHENRPSQTPSPISLTTMILTSWLSRRRLRRCLCLLLCSPFLLPLFCATFPIICAVEICYRLRRRPPWKSAEGFDGGDGQRRFEGGEGSIDGSQGTLLLQRYLDDQLLLVIESVYNCGDEDEEDGLDVKVIATRSLLLQ